MASQAPIIQGVCKRFDAAKGFGYITVSDGLGEVFVHQKEIKSAGCQLLKRGDLVQFNVVSSGGGGRKAVNVVLMEPVSDGVNIDVKVVVTPNPAVRAVIEQIEGATPKVVCTHLVVIWCTEVALWIFCVPFDHVLCIFNAVHFSVYRTPAAAICTTMRQHRPKWYALFCRFVAQKLFCACSVLYF